MKNYISRIFSIYILVLALIPCSDMCYESEYSSNDRIHIEQAVEDNHDDNCTPYCACLCCNNLVKICDQFVFEYYKNPNNFHLPEKPHSSYFILDSTTPPPKA